MEKIALRIDVDTFRGTRQGVPRLLRLLDSHNIRALFLFSVGPDNMGRNLWRLLRPRFLLKMLRSRAPGLYGWDILLRGTFWPGPLIAQNNREILRDCAKSGHEIGVHAWDHYTWQRNIESMPPAKIREHLRLAYNCLSEIIGRKPDCAAAPGWRCTRQVLQESDAFRFRYLSDCLGTDIFYAMADGKILKTPQIPRTLPTLDEIVGRNGITFRNYNERLLQLIRPGRLNTLTIHAEAEGGICLEMFQNFLCKARERGFHFCSPGELLPHHISQFPVSDIEKRVFPGRDDWMAVQKTSHISWQ